MINSSPAEWSILRQNCPTMPLLEAQIRKGLRQRIWVFWPCIRQIVTGSRDLPLEGTVPHKIIKTSNVVLRHSCALNFCFGWWCCWTNARSWLKNPSCAWKAAKKARGYRYLVSKILFHGERPSQKEDPWREQKSSWHLLHPAGNLCVCTL